MTRKYHGDGSLEHSPQGQQYRQAYEQNQDVIDAGIEAARRRLVEAGNNSTIAASESSPVHDVTASVDRSKLPPTIAQIRQEVAAAAAQQQTPPHTAA